MGAYGFLLLYKTAKGFSLSPFPTFPSPTEVRKKLFSPRILKSTNDAGKTQ